MLCTEKKKIQDDHPTGGVLRFQVAASNCSSVGFTSHADALLRAYLCFSKWGVIAHSAVSAVQGLYCLERWL